MTQENRNIELHICQHCPCEQDSRECQANRLFLSDVRTQGYQCKLLRYRANKGLGQY